LRSLFRSFFQGGFECSTHRLPEGGGLDLLESTGHARHPLADYDAAARHGLTTVRDGLRWHLIEPRPGEYDWSSLLPQLQAARMQGTQVIWDLCHYGYPDHIDPFSPVFPQRFARFAAAAAAVIRNETPDVPWFCPVNEISYWSWAGGDMALFGPAATERGGELKRQLVRAAIAAMDAIRTVDGRARFVAVDPMIHVTALDPAEAPLAEAATLAQFEAWDMLAGRVCPELGGHPDFLDVVGVNYYPHNQWTLHEGTLWQGQPYYRPMRELLAGVHARYARPVLVAETGAEGDARAPWLRYVCDEVIAAMQAGVEIEGVCLYPITDYPGWFDDRHCPTGLFGSPDPSFLRPLDFPLAHELAVQRARFADLIAPDLPHHAAEAASNF